VKALYALPIDPDLPPPAAEIVNYLILDDLPHGKSRVFVELVGDGLATGVRVPVLVARGYEPGPVFGLTACVHGNELNGIPVIHEIFSRLDPKALRGTVVGVVVVNVPGLLNQNRHFAEGADLNRIMPGRSDGNAAEVYAHRLLERILRPIEYLIDLHTASFGRLNSLYVRADMKHQMTAAMAYLQDPQIIVHNPPSDRTLRGSMMARGVPAITVEIGDPQLWQESYTREAIAGIWNVMQHVGLVGPHAGDVRDPHPPVLCRSSRWLYTDRGGLLEVFPEVRQRLAEGEKVARVRNAFGDIIREYSSPTAGIVVGKSVNPVSQTGARILHLGEVATGADGFLDPEACSVVSR
jgi:uncharacterized protein